jgi:peptidoglycan hydrolase-like protein with peptidoglycan-binding domain
MHVALERRDWTAFARAYNGPTFAKNRYDEKLADAHSRFSASGLPDLDSRAVQLLLLYHGFDPGPIDGIAGAKTKSAIAAFCAKLGRKVVPAADPELRQMLAENLPAPPEV